MVKHSVDVRQLDAKGLIAAIAEAQVRVASLPQELRQQLEFGYCAAEEEGQMIARHGSWTAV